MWYRGRVASFQAIATETYATLDMSGVQVVCLSYMNPDSIAHARYTVRRLRRRTRVPVVGGFWSRNPAGPKDVDLVTATRAVLSATSLREALEDILELSAHSSGTSGTAIPK